MTGKKVIYQISNSLDNQIIGDISFDPVQPENIVSHRLGEIKTPNKTIDFITFSNKHTQKIIYLSKKIATDNFLKLLNLPKSLANKEITVPGQLILGAERSDAFSRAIDEYFKTEIIRNLFKTYASHEVIAIPILREGIKYGISDALFNSVGYFSHEIVADVHHVQDQTAIPFKRKAEIALFKDADLTKNEREKVKIAFVGDSVASGIALIGLFSKLEERFPNLERIEFISPLATALGVINCSQKIPNNIKIRWHIFETILDVIKPDYYWSPHFSEEKMHINANLQEDYSKWWGTDSKGNNIAKTACSGYGWSESFFNPPKQIGMINDQLRSRHKLSIRDLILRNSKN